MKFSAIFIVFTFVLAGSASTPADVKADVTAIVGKVMNLDNVITQLPMKGATVDQFTVYQLLILCTPTMTMTSGYSTLWPRFSSIFAEMHC